MHAKNGPPGHDEIIRWGDQQTLVLPVTEIVTPKTIQLVKVHRPVPESWRVTLIFSIQIVLPAVYDVTAAFDLIIGAGSAQVNLLPTIRLQSAAGGITQDYNSLTTTRTVGFLLFDLPSRDIQINCTNAFNNSSPAANVIVGALAAPRFTPYADDTPDPGHRHMPEGFFPEQLVHR
ncbi:MAG: hypothetical protein KGK07_13590 [Chloroflexota bacterium]|nr:hypothetical protein [Chloroflexota bacterium]